MLHLEACVVGLGCRGPEQRGSAAIEAGVERRQFGGQLVEDHRTLVVLRRIENHIDIARAIVEGNPEVSGCRVRVRLRRG
jgi:hypothetical protein